MGNEIPVDDIQVAVASIVRKSSKMMDRIHDGKERHVELLLLDHDGWNIIEVLKSAVACAVVLGLDDDCDYRLVRQALIDRLSS